MRGDRSDSDTDIKKAGPESGLDEKPKLNERLIAYRVFTEVVDIETDDTVLDSVAALINP